MKSRIGHLLKSYDSLKSSPKQQPAQNHPRESFAGSEWDIVEGIYRKDTTLKYDEPYGDHKLKFFFPLKLTEFKRLNINQNTEGELLANEVVFFDIETTGLQSVGGLIFLASFGFFEDDRFVCRQLFLPSPDLEKELIKQIKSLLEKFNFLCTFNGKRFDLPFLQSRFVMNYRDYLNLPLEHLDLYHISRRFLPKNKGRFKLQQLEQDVLNLYRVNDIPGNEIGQVYFDYIKFGKIADIDRIVIHNQLDTFSMCFLMCHFSDMTVNKEKMPVPSRGKIAAYLNRNFRRPEALSLLVQVEPKAYIQNHCARDLYFCGCLLKYAREYKKSKLCFNEIINSNSQSIDDQLKFFSMIKLAMIEEHYEKNFALALKLSKQALTYAINRILFIQTEKRILRLQKKTETIV